MRLVAVFDTNVLFSSVAWKGRPFECLELARGGTVEGQSFREIIERADGQAADEARLQSATSSRCRGRLASLLHIVPISGGVRGVVADPDDDKVLETAVVAGATHIVTGDQPPSDTDRNLSGSCDRFTGRLLVGRCRQRVDGLSSMIRREFNHVNFENHQSAESAGEEVGGRTLRRGGHGGRVGDIWSISGDSAGD